MPPEKDTTVADKPKGTHRLDIIIVAGILIVALVGFVAVKLYSAATPSDTVEISSPDGDVYLPLDKDTRYVVSTELGNNTVVIEDETVHIEDADCKNHVCMEEGTITMPGQTLICLPHKLVVKIVSADSSGASSSTDTSSGGTTVDSYSK